MPTSASEGKDYISAVYRALNGNGLVDGVMDIGAGCGTFAQALGPVNSRPPWTGIEVWAPYVRQFDLDRLYDEVVVGDVRLMDLERLGAVSVCFAGDVLEHMEKEACLALIDRLLACAQVVIVSIPIRPMPQGEARGNPFERHVKDDWSHAEVLQAFPAVVDARPFDTVGVYVLCAGNPQQRQVSNLIRPLGGTLQESRSLARAAAETAPGDEEAWADLARVELAAGEPEAALAAIDRAIGCAPYNAALHLRRQYILESSGDLQAALGAAETAAGLAPEDYLVHYQRGRLLLRSGELEEAKKALQAAAGLRTGVPRIGTALSQACAKLGELDAAIAEAEGALFSAMRFSAESASHWHHLGNLLLRAGRLDEAEAAQRRAIARNQGLPGPRRGLQAVLNARARAKSDHPGPRTNTTVS